MCVVNYCKQVSEVIMFLFSVKKYIYDKVNNCPQSMVILRQELFILCISISTSFYNTSELIFIIITSKQALHLFFLLTIFSHHNGHLGQKSSIIIIKTSTLCFLLCGSILSSFLFNLFLSDREQFFSFHLHIFKFSTHFHFFAVFIESIYI